MLTEPWPYWAALGFAAAAWAAVPLAHYWEKRSSRKDAELWERLHGGDIYSRRVDP